MVIANGHEFCKIKLFGNMKYWHPLNNFKKIWRYKSNGFGYLAENLKEECHEIGGRYGNKIFFKNRRL